MESKHNAPSGSDSIHLPADSYDELLQIRDQLLLHARCIAPITYQEDDAILELSRNMLADCFQQLALRLARALETTTTIEAGD
ncbi:MAG: hypothetical protein V4566_04930 [Pseudomonadota bacterium]|jgi:hypothetical protein